MKNEQHDAEARLRRRIDRFARLQAQRRRWVSFDDIADYCAREDGSIVASEQKRALTYERLVKAALAGFFEEHGRSQILFLNSASNQFRMTRTLLNEAIICNYDGEHGRRSYLPYCWVRWEAVKRWFQRQRLTLPPEWLAQVNDKQLNDDVVKSAQPSLERPDFSKARAAMARKPPTLKPPKVENVAKALSRRFPDGRPSLTRDELLREIADVAAIGRVSLRTIDRAIPRAWTSTSPKSAKSRQT